MGQSAAGSPPTPESYLVKATRAAPNARLFHVKPSAAFACVIPPPLIDSPGVSSGWCLWDESSPLPIKRAAWERPLLPSIWVLPSLAANCRL